VTVAARSRRSGRNARRVPRAPLVDVGAEVGPDTTVCIIEVMKMMTSVHAGIAGTIVEVCVANGEPVEYGAPLFRVEL